MDWWAKHSHELKEAVSAYRIKQQARIQRCSKGHEYLADSHEYPCPYCAKAGLEERIVALTAQLATVTAERDVMRGVDCEADGDGPCGVCVKCLQRDLAQATSDLAQCKGKYRTMVKRYGEAVKGRHEARARAKALQDEVENLALSLKGTVEELDVTREALGKIAASCENCTNASDLREWANHALGGGIKPGDESACEGLREALRAAKEALKIARVWVLGSEHYRSMHDDLVTIDAVLALPLIAALGDEVPRG